MTCVKIGVFVEDSWVSVSYFAILSAIRARGYLPLLITTNKEWDNGLRKSIQTQTGEPDYYLQTDLSVTDVKIEDFAGFIFGGGYWADKMRWWFHKESSPGVLERPEPLALVKSILQSDKHLTGVICHSMWLVVSAKGSNISGKSVTCAYNIIDDVKNAGFNYVDEDVYIDGNLVTGRMSDHSPQFIQQYLDELESRGLCG